MLFADLVGFTSLSERLDAEDIAAIQDRYFAALRDTVDRHGGVLEKFIGDAAMAAFGIPRTHEDDPERAVLAGLAIAAAVERLNGPLGLPAGALAVRVGIATGEVAYATSGTDAGRLTGDAVNTAARLQTAAPAGGVLVGETTALAVAESVDLEPIETFTLKGKTEPVRAAVVREVRPNRSREAAMADLRAPMLGRATEMALLVGAADRARRGRATETWLVVAPPGTGKTRLIEEVAAVVATTGLTVHRARFRARDSRPFGALTDVGSSALAGSTRGDAAATDDSVVAALIAAALPAVRAEVVAAALRELASLADGTGESRDSRFSAWLSGIDGLAVGQGSIWLVEDLHWAGPDAIAFLDLARSSAASGGRLIVATARPSFLDDHPGWADAKPATGQRFLELATLPPATTVELVTALVGPGTLPAALVERIAIASDGNCLYVEELIRLWVSAGILARRDGAWELTSGGAAVGVPTSVQAVYAAQLDELPADARHLVRRGAISGRRVADGWLDRLDLQEPRRVLASLQARRLLDGPVSDPLFGSAYVYRHALLRDAAYASLARADRAMLHVRFTRWLLAYTASPDTVAELLGDHLEAALDAMPALAREVADGLDREAASREAASWLERAAERAIRAGAREHAVALFQRALTRTPGTQDDALDLARRERRLGQATADAGRLEAAVERLKAALVDYRAIMARALSAPIAAEARLGLAATGNALARVLHEQLLFEESAATADRVLHDLGDADDTPAAWLRLRAATARSMFSDDPADIVPTATAVIAIAERFGDRELALEARLAVLTMADLRPEEMISAAEAVASLAGALERPEIEARALRMRAAVIGEFDGDATAALETAERFAVSHGLDESLGWVDYLRAEITFKAGDWDGTLAAGLRAVALGERHGYHRIVVRTWHAVVPVAAARDDRALLRRAAHWYDTYSSFFPDSPYGRLMRASVGLAFSGRGVRPRPDLEPDGLLPSFSAADLASWLDGADVVVQDWLANARFEAAAEAVERTLAEPLDSRPALTRGGVGLISSRVMLATGHTAEAVATARGALEALRAARAPWWIAKTLRLLGRADASTAEETMEAAAIEHRLGCIEIAP